jgi:hypothetical protein
VISYGAIEVSAGARRPLQGSDLPLASGHGKGRGVPASCWVTTYLRLARSRAAVSRTLVWESAEACTRTV